MVISEITDYDLMKVGIMGFDNLLGMNANKGEERY